MLSDDEVYNRLQPYIPVDLDRVKVRQVIPVIKDRLALRLDSVKANGYTWRGDPSGRDDWRYYGAITAKPFKLTTLRAYYEDSSINQTPPRNTRILPVTGPRGSAPGLSL